MRADSVPPPNLNNLCLGSARAQSEQLFGFGTHQSAFSNFQRSHRAGGDSHLHPQQQQLQHQQQPFLNNAAPPPTHFNNETPLSPPSYRNSPGPIFMNHHNNTIHQNNANLRTQNQHANNLHPSPREPDRELEQRPRSTTKCPRATGPTTTGTTSAGNAQLR